MTPVEVDLLPLHLRGLGHRGRDGLLFCHWRRGFLDFLRGLPGLCIWTISLGDLGEVIGEMNSPFLIDPFVHLAIAGKNQKDKKEKREKEPFNFHNYHKQRSSPGCLRNFWLKVRLKDALLV